MIDISKYEINIEKLFGLTEEKRKIVLDFINDYKHLSFDSQANIATTRFFEMLGNTLISNEYLVTVRERKLNEVLE